MISTSFSHKIDLNLLRIFLTVYHERNLKKSAAKLSLSPSSISLKMTKLKRELNGELFFKTTTGLEPTILADQLYRTVAPILNNLLTSIDNLNGFNPKFITEPICIDFGQNLITWLAPALAEKIQKLSPESHLIANYFTDSTLQRIGKGDVSIGIQIADLIPPKQYWTKEIGMVEMGAIVRKDHPFKKDIASVDDLLKYEIAVYEQFLASGHNGGPLIKKILSEGKTVNIKFRSPSFDTITKIIQNSDMILPTCLNAFSDKQDNFRIIQASDYPELTHHPVVIYIHQKYRHDPFHNWLAELLEAEFHKNNIINVHGA